MNKILIIEGPRKGPSRDGVRVWLHSLDAILSLQDYFYYYYSFMIRDILFM